MCLLAMYTVYILTMELFKAVYLRLACAISGLSFRTQSNRLVKGWVIGCAIYYSTLQHTAHYITEHYRGMLLSGMKWRAQMPALCISFSQSSNVTRFQ